MSRKIVVVVSLFVLAVVAYIAVQPMLTVRAIQQGLEQQDKVALEQHIDFPQVREGLKGQLGELLDAQLKAQAANNPFAMLGAAFVGKMADGIVEKMVTPKGLLKLLSVKPAKPEEPAQPKPSEEEGENQSNLTKADYRLIDSSLIELTMPTKEGQQPIKAHLTREGITWRLTEIIAPTGALMPK